MYVDLTYADGTTLWGQTGNFPSGTHDWVQREVVIIPQKPVRSLTLHCIFRGHSGEVLFDDVTVAETKADKSAMLFLGTAIAGEGFKARKLTTVQRTRTYDDDLFLALGDEGVAVSAPGMPSESPPGGFLVRDVAAGSGFYTLNGWRCDELELCVKTDYARRRDHIEVSGRITDLRNQDRAVTLAFAVPIEAEGWLWGDDARRSRIIDGATDFANVTMVPCAASGSMSLYPIAAISGPQTGLALAMDQSKPAVYRAGYHAGAKLLYVAYDFGLAPDTKNFPRSADFRFFIYRFDPNWGFRAALHKYMKISGSYRSRITDQGIWMPFTDISKVEGWRDFGFRFKEGNNNVSWDDSSRILTFRYTEPMTWWMRMDKSVPRTPQQALRVRDGLAETGDDRARQMAKVAKASAMHDEFGQPSVIFRDTPWCDGAVWSINPNPYLKTPDDDPEGEGLNGGTVHWNPRVKETYYSLKSPGFLDGEYLDSLEGYVTADLNYRREHFADTTVPLAFDRLNRRPALFKGLAVYEYTRWFRTNLSQMSRGNLLFANGVPYRFGFLCPLLDVLGTETDWVRNGKYQPAADSQMLYWRSISGQKPYLILMNSDFDVFTSEMVELYFQRSLFYGMFPSMFSHNASENPYWQNPRWYNRDRAFFKKYQPIIKRVAEAGWQPVTYAESSNPKILVERFGPAVAGTNYITVLNDSSTAQSGTLHIGYEVIFLRSRTATEMLSGKTVELHSRKIPLELKPYQAQVYAFEGNPAPHALNWGGRD